MIKKILILGLCLFLFSSGARAEMLEEDKVIQGIKFPKGTYLYSYESGKFEDALLSQDTEIQGIKCAKDYISFYESGQLGFTYLSQDQEIQGIKCASYISDSDGVSFWESGKLKIATLSQDQEIQGIKCARETQVWLYESGKLGVAYLSQDTEIQGIEYKQGNRIVFDENGEVIKDGRYYVGIYKEVSANR